jgi:multidrug efflux pump subunit AcrA (membrane-fusion protein)
MATVYAETSKSNEDMVSGMSVNAKINTGKDSVFVINSGSVLKDQQGNFVFVKKTGKHLKIPVQSGNNYGTVTEIFGLPHEMSDSVVISGTDQLNLYFNHP